MNFEIVKNEQYNSIEITFSEKPAAPVRDLLKARRFRWNGARGIWYGYADAAELAAALNSAAEQNSAEQNSAEQNSAEQNSAEGNRTEQNRKNSAAPVVQLAKEKAIPDELAAVIRSEYSRVWGNDKKMIDFCCGEVGRAAALENEQVLIWKKQKIETRFCFGESGYDYDDAQRMAAHARTSEDYFKRENLKEYDDILSFLDGGDGGAYRNSVLYLRTESYIGAGDLRLCKVVFLRPSDFYNMTESEKARIRLPYESELETIRAGYQAERCAMEKRLHTYLKRYGLSKIHAWTYWLDA